MVIFLTGCLIATVGLCLSIPAFLFLIVILDVFRTRKYWESKDKK